MNILVAFACDIAGCIYEYVTGTTERSVEPPEVSYVPVACRQLSRKRIKIHRDKAKGKLQCDYMLQETEMRFVNHGS